jgi:hypothetical protein
MEHIARLNRPKKYYARHEGHYDRHVMSYDRLREGYARHGLLYDRHEFKQ